MRLKNYCIPFRWGATRQITCEWQRILGEEYEFFFRFLLPTDDLSPWHPGNEASFRQELKVKVHEDGRVIGAVDRSKLRVELTKADILMHKFDIQLLRREMNAGFGLTAQSKEIGRWDATIPWGIWEPEKGATFPITFFMEEYMRPLRDRVMEAALNRQAAGEIILTPDRTYWQDDVLDIARKNKLLLVPMSEIAQSEDGKLCPTPEWSEYLAAFCKMVEMDLPSSLQKAPAAFPNEFRKKGQAWIVRFEGRDQFIKDGKGPRYISLLLAKPDERVCAADLQAIVAGKDPATVPAVGNAGTMSDRETLRDIEKEFRSLQADLEQARIDNDTLVEQEILDEMKKLEDYARKATDGRGKLRKTNNDSDSLRVSVAQAIDRTINEIEKELPNCGVHLRNAIHTGTMIHYESQKDISWVL